MDPVYFAQHYNFGHGQCQKLLQIELCIAKTRSISQGMVSYPIGSNNWARKDLYVSQTLLRMAKIQSKTKISRLFCTAL